MDFVDGIDAGRLLQEHPNGVPPDIVLDIVKGVASALDYAHGMYLLHRAVKPAIILIAGVDPDERRVLLADFGVARDLADTASGSLTATNMAVGTPAYAAPEQLMGLAVDGRTDQYSLAATAYHLLTGEQLFPHSNAAVVIGKHLNSEPPMISAARPELRMLDAALARALSKSPDDRFATCMEFARALEQPAEPESVTTSMLSPNSVDTMVAPVASPPPSVAAEPVPQPKGLAANGLEWPLPPPPYLWRLPWLLTSRFCPTMRRRLPSPSRSLGASA
jgi:serine/threonine protein kinase